MKTKVLIIQRIFSNYRKPIYDRLAAEYELRLLHSKNRSGIKQVETSYSFLTKRWKYYKKETTIYLPVLKCIRHFKPDVIIHEFNPSLPSIFILFLLRPFFGFKVIQWGHGINSEKILKKKRLSILLRQLIGMFSNAIILYGNLSKKYFLNLVNPQKIFIAPNSLDTDELNQYRYEFDKKGLETIKDELNIFSKYNIMFVGRMLDHKFVPDMYFDLIFKVNSKIDDLQFHIIGDGTVKNEFNERLDKAGVINVNLYGSMYGIDLAKYLYVSDLLLNPGYLGLSIIHAFSFGTPVVSLMESKKGPYHSPEVEHVIQMNTGYLAKNKNEIIEFIVTYFQDDRLRSYMKKNTLSIIENEININHMLAGINNAINYVTK